MKIDIYSNTSIYKQIVEQVERGARDGSLKAGEILPSMNAVATRYGISRETVKKAYGVLVGKGIIEARHGKGFYVKDLSRGARTEVLVLFDKFSLYKQIMYNSFAQHLGSGGEITILNHDQNPDILEYFLDNHLDRYDYYVVAPHFGRDPEIQKRVVKLLSRIPVKKLILIDHLQPGLKGNFGAVYQDFENDICDGLYQGIDGPFRTKRMRVITLPSSLYGDVICQGIKRFAGENNLKVEFLSTIPDDIAPGDTFIILNSQLDNGLVGLSRKISEKKLVTGKDVFIISYNEDPTNELILGGLTTVSTDFPMMGRIAADMILTRTLTKVRNPFRMTRRITF